MRTAAKSESHHRFGKPAPNTGELNRGYFVPLHRPRGVPNKVAGLRSGSNTSFGKTTLARASLNAIGRRVASHPGIARSLNARGVAKSDL